MKNPIRPPANNQPHQAPAKYKLVKKDKPSAAVLAFLERLK